MKILRTANLGSNFAGSYKKECISKFLRIAFLQNSSGGCFSAVNMFEWK